MRQRDRWQRGLIEMIARHRDMLLRPRYGRIGWVAMPYFILFELLGPTIECFGYAMFVLALALGMVSLPFALAFLAVSLTYGLVLSFLVILMEERAFRRYPGWSDLMRLTLCAVVENFGYRQLLARGADARLVHAGPRQAPLGRDEAQGLRPAASRRGCDRRRPVSRPDNRSGPRRRDAGGALALRDRRRESRRPTRSIAFARSAALKPHPKKEAKCRQSSATAD